MKIYVDEMPKSCWECRFLDKENYDGTYCSAIQKEFCDKDIFDKNGNDIVSKKCSLHSLADHDAELLKNAIVPKFKKGQEVWFLFDAEENNRYTILNKKVMACSYNNYEGDCFEYAMSDDGTRDTIWYGYIDEKYIFATKAEAEAKLKGLGENQ